MTHFSVKHSGIRHVKEVVSILEMDKKAPVYRRGMKGGKSAGLQLLAFLTRHGQRRILMKSGKSLCLQSAFAKLCSERILEALKIRSKLSLNKANYRLTFPSDHRLLLAWTNLPSTKTDLFIYRSLSDTIYLLAILILINKF